MSSMGDAPKAELVLDARNGTGESPVWHGAEQALYWVDIPARKLWRWTPSTGQATSWLAPEMLACIAPMAAATSWIAGAESRAGARRPQRHWRKPGLAWRGAGAVLGRYSGAQAVPLDVLDRAGDELAGA